MAVCWVILRGQQIFTFIQAVHSLLYIVAKYNFFSVVMWKDIIKYLQKCEGCTLFCEILYVLYSVISFYAWNPLQCHCGFNTCMSDSEDRCHLFLRHHILTKSDMKAWRYRSHFFHVISMCVLISHKWHTSRCLVCVLSCCMTSPAHIS